MPRLDGFSLGIVETSRDSAEFQRDGREVWDIRKPIKHQARHITKMQTYANSIDTNHH